MIVQIVPTIFPSISGVGDYALNLALQLRQDFNLQSHFVICDRSWTGDRTLEGFAISHLPTQTSQELVHFLSHSSPIILLHYVGYGYEKRGCPLWLINALERLKSQKKGTLVTMFHEVYAADRPPWTSAFWLSPLQKNIATRLAKISDYIITNKQLYADLLRQWSQRSDLKIPTLPVFSNVGELEQKLPLTERHRRLIIFGGQGHRQELYQNEISKLNHACHMLNIQEIWDIGSSINCPSQVGNIPLIQKGLQNAAELSKILSYSLCSFLSHNPDYLAKSGIFAAYCSHGMLTISAKSSQVPIDGIIPHDFYWVPDCQRNDVPDLKQMQAIADNAFDWYQTHNLSVHAKVFFDHLTHS